MKKKLLTILLSIFMIMGAYTTRVFANEITNVGDVIATNPNFPSDPEEGWSFEGNGVTAIAYVYNDKLYFQEKGNPTSNINVATTATLTKENDNYTVNSSDGKVTFVMESNSLKNIMVSGSSNETLNGTYTILLYWGYDESKETLYLSKTASAITTKGSFTANVFDATKAYTSQSVGWTRVQSDVEKVEILNEIKPSNMNSWFDKMSNLTQIIGITNLNTESVVSMSGLFYKCEKLETIDLSNFDTSNVTSMQNMFANCSNLTSLTFGENFDTSKVTTMSTMFCMCSSLETLDLRNFDTSKAVNVNGMFSGCSSLKTLDLSSFDLIKANNATNLIANATSLVQIKTPKNLTKDNALPSLVDPAAWYNAENFEKYKFLPKDSTTIYTLVAGYPITVSEGITNGTVTVAPTTDGNYIVGSTVTLTVAPSNGYQLKANSLKATYYDGVQNQTIIPTETQTEGQYTFAMPAYAVTVTAEFEEKAITIADILPDDFPTCVDVLPPNLWVNGNGVYMMVLPYSIEIFTLDEYGNPDYVKLVNDIRTATLTKNGNNYTYTNNGVTTTFLMSDNGLESVKIEGLTDDYVDFNGTYGEQHTHAPVLVNGQAATESAAGWKDYYECACGALFEDENGTTPIENLATWKAEGGNGYIAPLTSAKTIADVLAMSEETFPKTKNSGWLIDGDTNNYRAYIDGTDLKVANGSVSLNSVLTKDGDSYKINSGGPTYIFKMESNVLKSISYSVFGPGSGEYIPYKYEIEQTSIPKGSTQDLVFKTNGVYTNEGDVEVKLNNQPLTLNTDYKVKHGSIKVTLLGSYIKNLVAGTYTISIGVPDSYDPLTSQFTITGSSPIPTPKPGYVVPKTGVE